jgi:CRP-like cAMP-binding protein
MTIDIHHAVPRRVGEYTAVRQRRSKSFVNNGVIDILGSGGVFQQCSARDLKRISLFTDDLSFASKQIVFERGDPSSVLYVLADGLLKLTGSTSGGNEAVLEFVNPTASVCEQTVFTQQPFSVSAQALQPSRVLAVSMRSLLELMHARPPLAWKIVLLEQFADRTSRRGPKQTDMANMLAISPETLCRLLAKFRRSGWIANSDGQVIIVDPKGLHSVLPDTGPPPR